MYKKALSVFLVLVMAFGVFTIPVLAANDYLQLDKTNYEPNETITVSVTGITQQMANDEAFVAIYKKGAGHREWGEYHYPQAGSDVLTFTVPAESGDYEMRLYRADHQNDYGAVFITSVPFTVGKVTKQGSITLDAAKYTVGDEITVTVTGITAQMATADAFVAVYKKGAKHDEWGNYRFLTEGSSVQKLNAPYENGEYEMRLYTTNRLYTDDTFVMAVAFTVSGASSWATDTLQKADDMGLIPDLLRGTDLTKPITRKEFAAVAVKTYENLTGKTITPVSPNPFTDTNDTEVLKAYNVGITSGTSATTFSPDVLLNREQAATMLTRVLKSAYITGWTGATDRNYTLNFTQPAKFADDDKISDWAKPSVYFMVANGIIAGTGNNMFSPRAVTTAEQAANYASATREQALVIAVRMVENLKGKPLDYKEVAAQGTTTQEPTTATPDQSSDSLIGVWAYLNSGNWYERVYQLNSDGTFTAYELISGSQTWSDSSNSIVHQPGQTTYLFTMGNYKVNENKIEFYSKQAFNELTVDEKNAITWGASIQEIFSIVTDSRWRDVSVDVKEMPYEWVDSGTIKVTLSNGSKWSIVKINSEDLSKRYK